jgi:tetratricopeptide (TPR) repeat protein
MIRFDDPVEVDGHAVPAGTYGFFAIPTKQTWTLILNKAAKQWGAYTYDAKQDQLRWSVEPTAVPLQEWLSYAIDPASPDSAIVRLRWEKLEVAFTVKVDVRKVMIARIDRAIGEAKADDWQAFYQAARYYDDNDIKHEQALAWVEKSLAIQENYRSLELEARILHKMKHDDKALPAVERAMVLAKEKKASQAYLDGLSKLAAECRKS